MSWKCLLLLYLVATVVKTWADLQLYDMDGNPGVVMLKTGRKYIKESNIRIYHKVDLQSYGPLIVRCKTVINSLQAFENYREVTALLRQRVEKVMNIYRALYPIHKRKRSLDFLGTGIKFITGNMDSNDRDQINKDLNLIFKQNINLINENNKLVKINKQVESRINDMLKIIREQQKNTVEHANDFSLIKQTLVITDHLNRIEDHLNSIAETIHLAKFKIFSKTFLEPDELRFIEKTLLEQDVILYNVNEIYDFLEIKAVYLDAKIFFVVLVPKLKPGVFYSYLLAAIPKQGKIVHLPKQNALVGGNQTYFISQSCAGSDRIPVCNEEDLIDVSEDDCFTPLFRGSTGKCVFTNQTDGSKVRRLTDNHILLSSTAKIRLSSNCGLPDRNLIGNVLIFFKNCTVRVDSEVFTDALLNTEEHIDIIPLNGQVITESHFRHSLSLQNVHDLHLIHREWLENIERKATDTDSRNIGIFLVFLGLFLAMVVANVYARRTKLKDGGVKDTSHHTSHHTCDHTHTRTMHDTCDTNDQSTSTADPNTSLERATASRERLQQLISSINQS